MSIQAIAWVLEHSRSEANPRLVLIALANHANSETGQCDPGYRRIAHEANSAPSTVTSAVAKLVELGELVVLASGTGKATNKYYLPWLSTALSSARSEPRTNGGVVRGSEPVVRDENPVVRDSEPVVRDLSRAEPINRKQNRASDAPDGVAGVQNPTRTATEIAADDAASLEADGGAVGLETARQALAAARATLKSKPAPVSQLFDDTPDAAKTRHPSNLPERKDLE